MKTLSTCKTQWINFFSWWVSDLIVVDLSIWPGVTVCIVYIAVAGNGTGLVAVTAASWAVLTAGVVVTAAVWVVEKYCLLLDGVSRLVTVGKTVEGTVTIGFGELICLGDVAVEYLNFMFCLWTLSVIFHQDQTIVVYLAVAVDGSEMPIIGDFPLSLWSDTRWIYNGVTFN